MLLEHEKALFELKSKLKIQEEQTQQQEEGQEQQAGNPTLFSGID